MIGIHSFVQVYNKFVKFVTFPRHFFTQFYDYIIKSVMTSRPLQSEEEDLVLSARQGSLEAFTMLYDRYFPLVFRRVHYLVPEEDVEDVTQDIFIAVIRSLKNFRGEAKFSTWLRVLTGRQIAEYYRKRRHVNIPLLENVPTQNNSFPSDDVMALRQAFHRLPQKYREILLLRFAEDISFREIASLQNRSLEATKSLFRRAVTALSKLILNDESSKR